mmetsp:Transcript_28680/g.80747  ORF Transcript_28680/g.80747 Transcript_28680/m.80747 type:complete len:268 (-) Transcript_28680:434-1237(-)|eukprot:CAMPEP_0117680058 /NCGR_PEP_ID=MMETSP0804-20121206/18136_1 /TAXON_ID=1074897 /ORGANISM="Tetraselmis astigmatica, Strain CCMP880" /LENGTH=267 /DNA_ID=CAMNT_0005489503 /DNA_START=139 /DNA_END=942 /DNA_ORIENTATION=-
MALLAVTSTCLPQARPGLSARRSLSSRPSQVAQLWLQVPPQHVDRRRVMEVRSSGEWETKVAEAESQEKKTEEPSQPSQAKADQTSKSLGKGVNLFDPAATASRFLTRRFGILGGLGFVALLASTEGYEIVKALLETETEGTGQEIQTGSGLVYKDIKVGGGVSPKSGDFIGAQLLVSVGGETLLDTKKSGRPVAFTFGKRPYLSVNCEGLEEGLSTMKRGGVRELVLPPELAFGQQSRELPGGAVVPPGSTVKMVVTLEDVTGSYL